MIFKKNGGCAAFAPTGMELALSNDLSNTVQVWNVTANKEITSYSTPSPDTLTWSHDGSNIAVANPGTGGLISAAKNIDIYAPS